MASVLVVLLALLALGVLVAVGTVGAEYLTSIVRVALA